MARKVTRLPPPKSLADTPLSVIQAAIAAKAGTQAAVQRTTLREFVEAAWPTVEGRRQFLPSLHLDGYCALLEAVSAGQVTKAVVNMPPGLAKSLVGSVMWPAWDWGPNQRPDRRWLCLSYGGDADSPATRDAERCRDLITSPFYQRGWGTSFTLSETQNAKSFFANSQRGYRISTGLEGTASGQRADIVLIDDPTKMDEDSLAQILKPSDIYEATLMHRAQDDGSAFVLLMSRLHPDDLAGYFLKQDGWVHLNLPMFYDPQRRCRVFLGDGRLLWEDPRTIDGAPLHPLMTVAIQNAQQQARMRPDIFNAQQQQDPRARTGAIVTHVGRFPTDRHPLPDVWDEVIITVDCAFKGEREVGDSKTRDKAERSFVVFQKWARRHATAYLLDQYRKHMELPETCEALLLFCMREPFATAKYVEAKANGVGVVQILRNRIAGLLSTDDDEAILKPFCAGSKEAKLQAVAAFFLAEQALIPTADWLARQGVVDWTPQYVDEITTFPRSRFNDQVDASAMGVWRLLYAHEAHQPAAEVLALPNASHGLMGDAFEKAYVDVERAGLSQLAGRAFGHGVGLPDMMRGAYGR